MAVRAKTRRFTVDEYHRMAEAGILGEDDWLELIDGEIVEMAPIGRKHANRVRRIIRLFTDRIGHAAILDVQNPIVLGERSEPQPDLVLLRPRSDFYDDAPPTAADVLLLVEVSETSLAYDREVKIPRYARHGIPEAWIVDLEHDLILVFREPTAEGYRSAGVARRGESIVPLAFPDVAFAVSALLG